MVKDNSEHFVPSLKGRNYQSEERVYIINFYLRYSSSTFECSALLLCNGGSMRGRPGGSPTPPPPLTFVRVRMTALPPFSGGLDPPMLCSKKKQPLLDSIKLNVLSNGNSIWDFLLDVLFLCTCSPQNLLPARIVLLLGVEGHYHYWDGIFPCLPAKLSMVKYIYQLGVALGQYRVETVTSDLLNLGMT